MISMGLAEDLRDIPAPHELVPPPPNPVRAIKSFRGSLPSLSELKPEPMTGRDFEMPDLLPPKELLPAPDKFVDRLNYSIKKSPLDVMDLIIPG